MIDVTRAAEFAKNFFGTDINSRRTELLRCQGTGAVIKSGNSRTLRSEFQIRVEERVKLEMAKRQCEFRHFSILYEVGINVINFF